MEQLKKAMELAGYRVEGLRKGAFLQVGKWARVMIYECQGKFQDWGVVGNALASVMGVRGMICINPFIDYKGIFFLDFVERVEWFEERGRLVLRGGMALCLQKCLPRENALLESSGRNWGKVTEVDQDTLKHIDLSKVKLKLEMNPNMVLPPLLEVIDGAWVFTVVVLVIEREMRRVVEEN
ncbi:hypothetical protein AAG906_017556 [Vitis piasezkii]